MKNYKKLFPIYKNNPTLHYLDSGATALKPQVVLDKMMDYYTNYSANIHRGLYPISEKATEEYEKVRGKVSKFIGVKSANEIIFTSGTTDSINMVAAGWAEFNLKEGDEVVVTVAEHHSNFVPWQQLSKKLNLKFTVDGEITKNTKLLAINQVSNVLGTVNNIKEIIKKARMINPDICVVVDGAQAVAHMPVDMVEMDCDFYTFSGHKMYGPTGVGVLYGKAQRLAQMNAVNFGGGMIKTVDLVDSTWAEGPEKFEAGTPPIGGVIGLGAAIDFINKIGMQNIVLHEKELANYLFNKLSEIKWIEILGLKNSAKQNNRIGVVSMYSNDKRVGTSHDIADILGGKFNVAVRAGHHCAMPLHTKFGIETGTVRASIGIYNDKKDIDQLILGLQNVWMTFIKK